ncbi:uncharacterized protein LOC129586765 isoform X2 [Paramacrobiotus metropolitanus]|uniref:uncharacterized protein LOC129586765 isoform X2 n=1 Tax=Paramacrobiotus metropolitanus TaxID=2943436 RepID=UPI0024457B32|nr:uncharacterized protein LOC129586765 isoform X2 [Paramacrobiotus metropolitanus]
MGESHSSFTMKKYFKNGLKSAMGRYSKSPEIKRAMDQLQIQLKCCGSNESADWFTIAWIDNAYLDLQAAEIKKDLKDGVYKADNVPFSCCNTNISRPCIHRNVKTPRVDYIWPKDSTLYNMGCTPALAEDFGRTTLNVTGYIVVTTYLLMWVILVILKLLSTGIANTYPWGDPEGDAPTWLLEMCPIQWCDSETPKPPDDTNQGIPGLAIPHRRKSQYTNEAFEADEEDSEQEVVAHQPLLRDIANGKPPSDPVLKHRLTNTFMDDELPDIVYSNTGQPQQRSFNMISDIAAKRAHRTAAPQDERDTGSVTDDGETSMDTNDTSRAKRKKNRKQKKPAEHSHKRKTGKHDKAKKKKKEKHHNDRRTSKEEDDTDYDAQDNDSAGNDGDGGEDSKSKKKDKTRKKDGAQQKHKGRSKKNRSQRRKKR